MTAYGYIKSRESRGQGPKRGIVAFLRKWGVVLEYPRVAQGTYTDGITVNKYFKTCRFMSTSTLDVKVMMSQERIAEILLVLTAVFAGYTAVCTESRWRTASSC